MNRRRNTINNFLFDNLSSEGNLNILINFCIKQSEKSRITLFLATKSFENCSEFMNIDLDILNRIVIMYFNDINKITSKLLELHVWAVHPSVVILDIDGFFNNVAPNRSPKNQKVCLLISSLLNYMKYLETVEGHLPISIVLINSNKISDKLFKNLVDLYFYDSSYNNIDRLINVLPLLA